MAANVFGGFLGVLLVLLAAVLAVLWFLWPFAVFGTKDRLAVLIAEARKPNEELAQIRDELASLRRDRAS